MADILPVFRAPKRRKVGKVNLAEDGNDISEATRDSPEAQPIQDHESTVPLSRRPKKPHRSGVTFRSSNNAHTDSEAMALARSEPSNDRLLDIASRFTGTTGQVVDVDKNMYVHPVPIDFDSVKPEIRYLTR
jgi:hypothetical protein